MSENQKRASRVFVAVPALLGFLLMAGSIFAAGQTEEDDFEQVSGSGNWEHTIDVSDLEEGVYNIIVRARDAAGNEAIGGPFNIFVDSEVDFPTVNILYPQADQRATDELFLVGTAQDNEWVDRVEVQINDGRFVPADGAEFWSLRLPLETLEDGPHTVAVRAVDNNGLVGPEESVRFRVDTRPPEVSVESHGSGVFITRRTTIEGTVSDANGVESLYLDRDGHREALRLRGRDAQSFSFRIDPRDLSEGSHVWSLIATDRTGRTGTTPFLFFVDTEPPEIDILYPGPDDRVDSQLRFAGRVSDAVGVDSLSYSLSSGHSGEIPLTPGDPFWNISVDLEPGARGRVTADFTVRDVAGNERSERVRLSLDPAGDEPVVHRISPAEGAVVEQPVFAGHLSDDDGVAELVYTVNDRDPVRVPVQHSFTVPLSGLPPGRNEIRYFAVDRHGVAGSESRVRFEVARPLPDIELRQVRREDSAEAYEAGFALEARERASVTGRVDGLSGGRVAVAIGDRSSTASVAADGTFDFALPRSNEPGVVEFSVEWRNESGREVTIPGFYVQLPPEGEESAAARAAALGDRQARLGEEWPLRVEGVSLPVISAPEAFSDRRLSEIPEFDFSVDDDGAIRSVRVRTVVGDDESQWLPAETAAAGRFAAAPGIPATDGRAVVEIEAVNDRGGEAVLRVPFVLDRAVPEVVLLTPSADDVVNGRITVAARLHDRSAVARVEFFSPGSESGRELAVDELLSQQIAVTDEERTVGFRVTTHAGTSGEQEFEIATDESADIPELILQVPQDGSAVQDTLRVSGVVLDDDIPEAVTVAVNGAEPIRFETDGLFDFTVSLDDYPDGAYDVEVVAYDIGGTASPVERRTFVVSRSEPDVELQSPGIDEFRSGRVQLSGTATDPNGIGSVAVSIDGGATFHRAAGGEEWSWGFDTSLLDDGTHSVLVRARDTAGDEGLLATIVNVDNTPPGIELQSPSDGEVVGPTTLIDGRVDDCNVNAIRVFARKTDGSEPERELATFNECGPFTYSLDTGTLEPGTYSVVVRADDRAGNESLASRTIIVQPPDEITRPTILLPASGSEVSGRIQGVALSPPSHGALTVLANGRPVEVVEPDERGRAQFAIESDRLPEGDVVLQLRAEEGGAADDRESEPVPVVFSRLGPWLSVDGPAFLDYVRERPFLTGSAGYALELPEGDDRDTRRQRDALVSAHAVERVEVSLDNGVRWSAARGTDTWRYRIETTELSDGRLNMLVRARFADGSTVTRRHSVVVDEQPPIVRLLSPNERERFSGEVQVVGVTADNNELADVAVALRPGNKSRYEVPGFIQGLYIDAHIMGATYWDIGAGLTFFDNNVRLQTQIGLAPPGRFSGLVIGTKLLANVASLPASYLFGPDFEWLSGALAVGANFSYFTMSEDSVAFTDDGLVLAGMLAQLEFPIVSVPEWSMFNTYAFYTEAQLWFISSDVDAGTAFRVGFGVRADVF